MAKEIITEIKQLLPIRIECPTCSYTLEHFFHKGMNRLICQNPLCADFTIWGVGIEPDIPLPKVTLFEVQLSWEDKENGNAAEYLTQLNEQRYAVPKGSSEIKRELYT